ncbi:MAG: DUF92 domain-containing protein [Saprospiraceae bacterium]|mgnify:FL=1
MELPENWLLGLTAALILTIGSLLTGKIDRLGAIVGGLITFAMFLGSQWLGIATLTLFFVAGTLVSQFRKEQKKNLELEQENEGKRTIINAVSNGGVAGVCGLLGWLMADYQLIFEIGMLASIASATSDTFSSELGNVFGKRYYNIITWKADKRGLDGAISLEGTLAGLVGSCLIGCLYIIFRGWDSSFLMIVMIGLLGNLSDSYFGATLQRKGFLDNNQVNLLSTLLAGGLGVFLCFLIL